MREIVCLRFHWVEETNNNKIEIYRFASPVFKFKKSPFTLEETLDAHSDKCGQEFSEVVEKVIIW